MRIQNLAIIFIIIILPISIVLSSYMKNRIETISIQSQYDTKLNDATHDAIKAYQVNSFSNDTGSLTNSKIRDIEASVNTFFNSLSTNFSTLGYTKETLQNYVPAIVYTMYDGYYIYTPFTNTWYDDKTDKNIKQELEQQIGIQGGDFSNGSNIYGLKPYVYYSCRYSDGTDENDVTITYSLDNYVQIQGKTKYSGTFSVYGYLYSTSTSNDKGLSISDSGDIFYNGAKIEKNQIKLEENVCGLLYTEKNDGKYEYEKTADEYQYIKQNGSKFYLIGEKVYYLLDGKFQEQTDLENQNSVNYDVDYSKFKNDGAYNYFNDALKLNEFIQKDKFLQNLGTKDIVNVNTGKKYTETETNPYYPITGNQIIFDFDHEGGIESETSNFNTHRIDVIKNSIESNLSVAIHNFNHFTPNVTTDFKMPKLKDSDWDKIMNNISVISFMQGVNIGGKVYNGYSIITNTMNEDVVMEDSIYIKNSTGIHNITEEDLKCDDSTVGIFNINTEPRVGNDDTTFIPVNGDLSYDSIITKNNISNKFNGNLQEYVKSLSSELKQVYYTALARERYGLYRQQLFIKPESNWPE